MDYLASSLGLDINAIAIKLATDDEVPAAPAHAQNIPAKDIMPIKKPKTIFQISSTANTPEGHMRADEIRQGVLIKG